jgi:hypothetical protein
MEHAVTDESTTIPPGTRFRIAMILAILADALQVIFLPLLVGMRDVPFQKGTMGETLQCEASEVDH